VVMTIQLGVQINAKKERSNKMGYLHIENLYKDQRIFEHKECYALEKIHGTSAHIGFKKGEGLTYFAGGENYNNFVALFDHEKLRAILDTVCTGEIIVFGEAYGGKQQGMSGTYGKQLKFIVFDVKVNGEWLTVPHAAIFAKMLELEFVDFAKIPVTLVAIDAERAKPSVQAVRNGILEPKQREGIVLRPLQETYDKRGHRIITKHKNDSFMETKTPRQVDPDKLQMLTDANKIADEWVTEMRLHHVMQRMIGGNSLGIESTGMVIKLMIEDVKREAKGEILESKEAMRAISSATARLYKKWLSEQLQQQQGE
jgi:hypothetical protein